LQLSSLLYSDDDAEQAFSAALDDGDDDLNWLFPSYIDSSRTFVCPSTRNSVNPEKLFLSGKYDRDCLVDLADNAMTISSSGSSYELFGFMGRGNRPVYRCETT